MSHWNNLPQLRLGVYPTPFYRLENISRIYNKSIWIKRDDLCGVALGGNKVRKLEYLLADAQKQGCDTVFTTGGAQSNHAMLTAACAARLGLRCVLILKKRGVTDHKGNLVLDDIFGAQVEFMDTDSYEDIYAEMRKRCEVSGQPGAQGLYHPRGRLHGTGLPSATPSASGNWRSRPRRPESRSAMWPPPLAPAAPPPVWCWVPPCFSRRPRPQVWAWIPTPLRRSYPNW